MITELHIYDFDGTLFKSPTAPEGFGPTWWDNPISLSPPCVPRSPGGDWYASGPVQAIGRSISRPDVYTVVMTGRSTLFKPIVGRLLANAGIKPNELILKPGGRTEAYKIREMLYLLKQFPSVHTVVFWEDRGNHLKSFQKAAERAGFRFVPKLVKRQEKTCPFSTEELLTQRVASSWMAYK